MTFKFHAFRAMAHASRATKFDRIYGRRYTGAGSIFVLHSVVHDRSAHLFDSLRTSADFLDRTVRGLLARGVGIVSLDEALKRLELADAEPFACFTFDDGYRDNLTVALPIFEKHAVPFSVYVTTCFLEHSIDNWWLGIADALRRHDVLDVPEMGQKLHTSGMKEKVAAYELLKNKVGRGEITRDGLEHLFRRHCVFLEALVARDALDITELKTLASHPLVEIGGHTNNHPKLAQLEIEDARREIVDNKRWLEDTLGQSVNHFAYPYGDPGSCGAREAELVRDAGFRSGVTTRIGNLFSNHLDRGVHALPRLRVFSEYESTAIIEFQRSGGAGALLSRLGNPVVTM